MSEEPSKDPEERFLNALGHRFASRELMLTALTHPSWLNEVAHAETPHNERFEFLGDAVLDLAVSDALMQRFPDAREGQLSRMRASMVHEGALARLARRLGLGEVLRLGRGELLSGGRDRDAVLADAFEAVVAAVYLDAGLDTVKRVLEPLLDFEAGERLADPDPKSRLQEVLQGSRKLTPRYRLVGEEGAQHAREFEVEVYLEPSEGEAEVLGRGRGSSKRAAERAAADDALRKAPEQDRS